MPEACARKGNENQGGMPEPGNVTNQTLCILSWISPGETSPVSLPYAAQCLIICGLIAFSQSHLLQLERIVIQPQDRSKQFRQIFVWELFVSIIGDCQGRDVRMAVESHTAILSSPRAGRFPGAHRLVRRRHSQRRGAGIHAGSAAGSAGRRRRAAPVPARRLAQGCQDSRRCRGKILLIYHNSLI